MKIKRDVHERFWEKVSKDADGCWRWTGCVTKGQGAFNAGGKMVPAHRFAWYEVNPPVPKSTRLRRSCAERLCVNPAHWREISTAERFWALVQHSDTCWTWTGDSVVGGYGRFQEGSRTKRLAHRYSYELNVGAIPDGMQVLHRCDNPPCVRPDHLFLGNDETNSADKVSKMRHCFGENHRSAKLTDEDVCTIRRSRRDALSLAESYGVTQQTIYNIRNRKTWRHL